MITGPITFNPTEPVKFVMYALTQLVFIYDYLPYVDIPLKEIHIQINRILVY